jgi:hypothetical protein
MRAVATNQAVLKALGLDHLKNITKVHVALTGPNELPIATITKYLDTSTHPLEEVSQRFAITLIDAPATELDLGAMADKARRNLAAEINAMCSLASAEIKAGFAIARARSDVSWVVNTLHGNRGIPVFVSPFDIFGGAV